MIARLPFAGLLLVAAVSAQELRLVDRIEAPMVYVALDGESAGARSGGSGAVHRLLADPAFDVLLGRGEPTAGGDAGGRALALVRGVLARSAGEVELALTSVLPADGQPLLVLRARLQPDEAGRLGALLAGPELAVPQRRLGAHQTFALREAAAAAAPGRRVELAVVGRDLLVANDGTALEELLAPAPAATSAAPRRVLSADERFVGLRKRLAAGPGALLVYGDWQRLAHRVEALGDGVPQFVLSWSGLGGARAVMASLAAEGQGFAATVLLDFDAAGGRGHAVERHPGDRMGDGPMIDGWFAATQAVPARSLLPTLPAGGLGGLVVSVDLASIAQRSPRGGRMLHAIAHALRDLGLDFDRNVMGRLGTGGTVQLLFRRAEGVPEVVSVYSLRAKSRKAASDLFQDLRRATELHGMGRIVEPAVRGAPDVLELRSPRGGIDACITVHEDSVLVGFEPETLWLVQEEHRRAGRARGKRDAAVAAAVASIGGDRVTGLFDLDLGPLFERIGAQLGGAEFDASRIPQRHIGYLDLDAREGGSVLRLRVLSAR